jgi:hypothetical protein
MPQIYDMGPTALTSPPKEGVLGIFFALKNPTALAEFEHAKLGTKGQHTTSMYLLLNDKVHIFISVSANNHLALCKN